MKNKFWAKKILKGIVIIPLVLALITGIVMYLWNHVMAAVTTVGQVNFWQALGLLVLSKILFGGFGGPRGRGGRWNNDMKEKWQQMTPEERTNFKQEWRNRCGKWGSHKMGRTDEEKTAL